MSSVRLSFAVILSFLLLPIGNLFAAEPVFDILYFKSGNLEQVLDYRESLSSIFPPEIIRKVRVMGTKKEYALVYDCNESRSSLGKILVHQGAALQNDGLGEPLGIQNDLFAPIYNISYGMGPNLPPLKIRYTHLYKLLGERAAGNLVIEKTDSGNYVLVLHFRGTRKAATTEMLHHKKLLRRKKFTASLTPENGNEIVYGESSHIDDSEDSVAVAEKSERSPGTQGTPPAIKIIKARKYVKYQQAGRQQEKTKKTAPLRFASKHDSTLEKSVEHYVDGLRRKGRIRGDEATGWMVYDLAQNRSLVDINANKAFQAASMIKPFVALAFFHKVKTGQLKYGSQARHKMALMIQRSNNAATNWVIKQVGGPAACNRIIHSSYPSIFHNTRIREYIPKGGRTYRNTAAPSDYVRFLKALWNNTLPQSRELRRLMALPGRDRIYNGTPIPKGTLVYNKTGSTAHLIGDMGILVPKTKNGRRYPYIVVGVIQRSSRPVNYGGWMGSRGDIIREVSTLVYKKMKKAHRLR